MKKLFVAVAMAVVAASAKDLTDNEIAKRDAAKWGGGMALYGRWADEAALMRERTADLSESIKKAVEVSALKKPGREATLTLLAGLLKDSHALVVNPEAGRAMGSKSGPDEDRGIEALNGLKKVLKRIDGNSRFNFDGLLAPILANDMVKLAHRMDAAVYQLEYARPSKVFKAFDSAYDEFMKYTGMMDSNKSKGITGPDILIVSKMDKFARNDFTPKASIDRTARVADGLVAVLTDESVSKLSTTLNDVEARLGKAKSAVLADSEYFSKHSMDICPKDRAMVAGLVANFVMLVDELQSFVETNRKLVSKIENKSSEAGMLRSLKEEISPNYALFVKGGPGANGHQEYARRIAEGIADCKKHYLKVARRINGPDWKDE